MKILYITKVLQFVHRDVGKIPKLFGKVDAMKGQRMLSEMKLHVEEKKRGAELKNSKNFNLSDLEENTNILRFKKSLIL